MLLFHYLRKICVSYLRGISCKYQAWQNHLVIVKNLVESLFPLSLFDQFEVINLNRRNGLELAIFGGQEWVDGKLIKAWFLWLRKEVVGYSSI